MRRFAALGVVVVAAVLTLAAWIIGYGMMGAA